jgi:hypothetical protein
MTWQVRGKMETYQDKTRLKTHVLRAEKVNYAAEGKLLLEDIAKYGEP